MAMEKTVKLSDVAYSDLEQYKREHSHPTFDSAVRELLNNE